MHMYFANAVLTTLFQWSFFGLQSCSWDQQLFFALDQIASCRQPYPIGILILRAVINNWTAVIEFFFPLAMHAFCHCVSCQT